jgi:protein-disulfide isomerase
MKTLLRSALVVALAAPAGLPLAAQVTQETGGITRQQAEDILKELRQIRQLLERPPAAARGPQEEAPTRAKISDLSGVSMLGSKNAPLTIVEFTDYQCPFCQRFHVTAFNDLKKNYIDTGKVRFFSKDMPLVDMHGNAMRAAQAARCAAEQGKFWELRDVMGANPNSLDMDHIAGFATGLKMDAKLLRDCVESEKYKNSVQTDTLDAMKIGATGTPTFIVGRSTGDGVEGELMVGAMPYQMFDDKLKSLAAK